MLLGTDVWTVELPLTSADRSQCNTPSGWCKVARKASEPAPEVGGS
jgi:hypothetical protein